MELCSDFRTELGILCWHPETLLACCGSERRTLSVRLFGTAGGVQMSVGFHATTGLRSSTPGAALPNRHTHTLNVLLLAFAILVVLCPTALANYQLGIPMFTRNGWDYSASTMFDGSLQKFWWCGSGSTSGYGGLTDVIYYRFYDYSAKQWSAIYQVITPVVGSWEFNGGSGTCNPTVVKGSFSPGDGNTYTYALYYTAQNDGNGKVGVAFSKDGVNFVKYAHNPIIYPIVFPSTGRYGCASSSSFNSNGVSGVYIFEYDDTASYGTRFWLRYAADGINFGAPSVISTSTNFVTTIPASDMGYDPSTQTFYAAMSSAWRSGDREAWQFGFYKMAASQVFSGGQGVWQLLGLVDTNLTGSYLNLQAKLDRDGYGNVSLPNLGSARESG